MGAARALPPRLQARPLPPPGPDPKAKRPRVRPRTAEALRPTPRGPAGPCSRPRRPQERGFQPLPGSGTGWPGAPRVGPWGRGAGWRWLQGFLSPEGRRPRPRELCGPSPQSPGLQGSFREHREENIRAILRVSSSGRVGGSELGRGRHGLGDRAPLVASLLSWRERGRQG